EAAPAGGEVAAAACGPTGAVTSSATSSPGAGSGLDRVHDVLRAGLAGEHKGDRVVHRTTDVLPEEGVEVQLDVRGLVTDRHEVGEHRVGDRTDGGRVRRHAHVELGEAGLDLVAEQVLDEVHALRRGVRGARPRVTATHRGVGVALAALD